ncbi:MULTISPECIES: MFS transporter [unclassified Streptomyces]|uniref:MFS transporter n=1 Tax=unclassified Streptomyces TaxID=2593676 RepID=UPI00037D09B8|nr:MULTISPECIES: MFS transporter [unclassified Streptomyces]
MAFSEPGGADGPSPSAEPPGKRGPRSPGPLLAVCAGYFMVILDVTIINVAAPAIGRDPAVSVTGIQWITDGYTRVFAGSLMTGGALGHRLGDRRVFCAGVVVAPPGRCGNAWHGTRPPAPGASSSVSPPWTCAPSATSSNGPRT